MTIEEELVWLREENKMLRERLAQRDELIQRQQALLAEQNAVIQHHEEQMSSLSEQMKALRDQLAKDSHNSHLPPSSDRFVRKPKSLRQKSEKKSGGQPGHPGSSLQFSSTPDEIIELPVEQCEVCQHDQQLLPLARTSEVMSDLLGVEMSEGTICDLIKRCAGQLVPVEQQIKEALKEAAIIHQDETGLYVAGKRQWMHVTCTPTLTHYHVDPSRGQGALEAIGILPNFVGISVHDGWGSYFLYDCEHAACMVHLLRDLVFLEEQGVQWAADLKILLLDMKEATEQARQQGRHGLDPLEVVDWEAQFLRVLDEGDLAHPRAPAPPGKRGRCKQSDARNLLDRLRKQQKAVLNFLEDLRVDFDNNLAERDLRMVKVQQKVSGCFRSVAGAQAFARIRGYLSTLRKQGLPVLSSLQTTLCGHPVLPSL